MNTLADSLLADSQHYANMAQTYPDGELIDARQLQYISDQLKHAHEALEPNGLLAARCLAILPNLDNLRKWNLIGEDIYTELQFLLRSCAQRERAVEKVIEAAKKVGHRPSCTIWASAMCDCGHAELAAALRALAKQETKG